MDKQKKDLRQRVFEVLRRTDDVVASINVRLLRMSHNQGYKKTTYKIIEEMCQLIIERNNYLQFRYLCLLIISQIHGKKSRHLLQNYISGEAQLQTNTSYKLYSFAVTYFFEKAAQFGYNEQYFIDRLKDFQY